MGSAFRLPVWNGPEFTEVIDWCNSKKILPVCTDASVNTAYTAIDWTQSIALILGPESTGLSENELGAVSQTVGIPMHGDVESLNVAVAAGILLFEAARQRRVMT